MHAVRVSLQGVVRNWQDACMHDLACVSIRRRLKIVAPEQNLLYFTHTHTRPRTELALGVLICRTYDSNMLDAN